MMLGKRLNITSQLKKLLILVALILIKTVYNTKISEIDKKVTTDYVKCISNQEVNKSPPEDFAARLVQTSLPSK